MRILISAKFIFSSGLGRTIREFIQVVAQYKDSISEIGVIVTGRQRIEIEDFESSLVKRPNFVFRIFYDNHHGYSPLSCLSLAHVRLLTEFDVIWYPHYPHAFWLPGTMPVVVTIPDCCHVAPHEARLPLLKRMLSLFYLHMASRRHLAFYGKSSYSEYCSLIKNPSRYSLTPCGVDASWFAARRESPDADYIICVGNLKPHKNIFRLISAVVLLREKGFQIKLKIAGKMSGFQAGIDIASMADICARNNIECVGEVSDNELRDLVANAAALISPSLYEGFGLPPLEAMAAGVPVIASDIPPMREIGKDVMRFFDPLSSISMAETIMDVLSDPVAQRRMRVEGPPLARHYTWSNFASRLIGAFEAAMPRVNSHE